MPWLTLLTLGVVIGANNLSAALALGALGHGKHRWRIVGIFAVFEFTAPLLGAMLGQSLAQQVTDRVPWLGAALLIGLGMLVLASLLRRGHADKRLRRLSTSWVGLMVLGTGLSADNLVVGFSLGLESISPLALATTIVVFSSVFTFIGVTVGKDLHRRWEQAAEIASGLLLIALGIAVALGWP
jgi:manganese efflux pump family protein